MSKLPSFAEFFEDVHGHEPFPWQGRLAERVLDQRSEADDECVQNCGWPALLDLPTGTGKTSALDVALYALAAAPERMPRRTLLVVDRRIVVDQGADHARTLLRRLTQATCGAAAVIAGKLRALWNPDAGEAPFAVATLRGGMPRDNDWARRPDQPVLGVSTVDQAGSRLLFRGYGVSDLSASLHAGLLGNDTLFLLDEVHLANPFAETLARIAERYRRAPQAEHAAFKRFAVVRMSATPGQKATAKTFRLDKHDRAHPVLAQRLGARKPAKLVQVDVRGDNEAGKREALAARAVAEALALQQRGAKVVGLVVNRVDTAREAWKLLAAHTDTERLLVTGRMRPLERDHLVRRHLLPRAGAGRPRQDDRPIIVVATQCIEAGADLDFDGLVTECASLDALRQRFGRLDRRGEVSKERAHAPAVILCRRDQASDSTDDPVYGATMAATWAWLQEHAEGDVIDFGSSALPKAEDEHGAPRRELLATQASAPALLPAHLDAWAHTSPVLAPSADPDPALWLHGPEAASRDVQVVWRADLLDEEGAPRELDDEIEGGLLEGLAQVRPSALEAMSLPIHAVRAWLQQEADRRGVADVVQEREDDERDERAARRHGDEARCRDFVLWRRGQEPRWVRDEAAQAREPKDALRPGDVVLVPTSYGGVNRDGSFDPAAREAVLDLGDLAQLRARAKATLRLHRGVLRTWGLSSTAIAAAPDRLGREAGDEREATDELKGRVERWVEARWPAAAPSHGDAEGGGGAGAAADAEARGAGGVAFLGTAREWQVARGAFAKLRQRPLETDLGTLSIVQPVPRAALREPPAQRPEPHGGTGARAGSEASVASAASAALAASEASDLDDSVADAVSEDDDSSFRSAGLSLKDHSGDVQRWSQRFAKALDLPRELAEDLALAGWLHDVGKADPRFQRWLVGGDEVAASLLEGDALLAKSALAPGNRRLRALAQARAGYPRRYRHELLSLAMIEASATALAKAHDRELVLHLVASHHGWCRPFAPPLDDPADLSVTLTHGTDTLTASTRHRKARASSGVAERFDQLNQRYGWWGLAWLEAVLRLADHRASEEAEDKSTSAETKDEESRKGTP